MHQSHSHLLILFMHFLHEYYKLSYIFIYHNDLIHTFIFLNLIKLFFKPIIVNHIVDVY